MARHLQPIGLNVHASQSLSNAAADWRRRVYSWTGDHHGFMAQSPAAIDWKENGATPELRPAEYARQMDVALPWAKLIRPVWNLYNFAGPAGEMTGYTPEVLAAWAARGYQILLTPFDGPTQRYFDTTRGVADFDRGIGHRHTVMWTRMMAFLDANPEVAAQVWGYEFPNEPNGYRQVADETGDLTGAVELYAAHVMAQFDLIHARHPRPRYMVPLWKFSYSLRELTRTPLPGYGGQTFDQVIQSHLGGRAIYSVHGFNGGGGTDNARFTAYSPNVRLDRFADWYADDVPIASTEVTVRNNAVNMVPVAAEDHALHNTVLLRDMDHGMGVGQWWWSATAMAKGFLYLPGYGAPRLTHRHAYASAIAIWSYPNNPTYFSGPQHGHKDETSADSVTVDFADSDLADVETAWAAEAPRPANMNRLTSLFGGSGTCVITCPDAQCNQVNAGDGHNVIYGGASSWDIIATGRGGGVVRTGGGWNVVYARHQQVRVHAGAGWNYLSCWPIDTPWPQLNALDHQITLVLDPAGHHYIKWWDKNPANKISFMGAFADDDALLAAAEVSYNAGSGWYELHLDLPGGGRATFTDGDKVISVLAGRNLDWTGGWYAPGWVEPADYDPAHLIASPPARDFDALYTLDGAGASSGAYNWRGEPIMLRDVRGNPIQLRRAA